MICEWKTQHYYGEMLVGDDASYHQCYFHRVSIRMTSVREAFIQCHFYECVLDETALKSVHLPKGNNYVEPTQIDKQTEGIEVHIKGLPYPSTMQWPEPRK